MVQGHISNVEVMVAASKIEGFKYDPMKEEFFSVDPSNETLKIEVGDRMRARCLEATDMGDERMKIIAEIDSYLVSTLPETTILNK